MSLSALNINIVFCLFVSLFLLGLTEVFYYFIISISSFFFVLKTICDLLKRNLDYIRTDEGYNNVLGYIQTKYAVLMQTNKLYISLPKQGEVSVSRSVITSDALSLDRLTFFVWGV